jgi:hypothetical protein
MKATMNKIINDNRTKPLKRVHTCSYCKDRTHLIDPKTFPNDRYAREHPENCHKWQCGDCRDVEMENIHLRCFPNSDKSKIILEQRIAALKRKADIAGYLNHLKGPDGYKSTEVFSYLFADKGINRNRYRNKTTRKEG